MAHKRVLVLGAVLVAAGIAVPTTAILTQGEALPEPRTPVVEPTTPAPPDPPELPVAVTSSTAEPPATSTAPRRVRAGAEVPSHLGEGDTPPRRQPADPAAPADPADPDAGGLPATRPAAPPEPDVPGAPPPAAEEPETPPPPPAATPDPADVGEDTGTQLPPPPIEDDRDPADQ